MKDLSCVLCDSPDFDLLGINHPVTKKPLGIVYCCEACKPEMKETIKTYAKLALRGCESYQAEWKAELEATA